MSVRIVTVENNNKNKNSSTIELMFFIALNALVIPFSAYQTYIGYEKDVAGHQILAIVVALISAVLFAAMNFGIREKRLKGQRHFLMVILDPDKSLGIVKVEDLLQLLNEHPYYDEVYESFDIKNIKNEFITVDFIDTVYGKIKYYIENYKRSVISSQIKNINVYEEETAENNQIKKHIIFEFDEYRVF